MFLGTDELCAESWIRDYVCIWLRAARRRRRVYVPVLCLNMYRFITYGTTHTHTAQCGKGTSVICVHINVCTALDSSSTRFPYFSSAIRGLWAYSFWGDGVTLFRRLSGTFVLRLLLCACILYIHFVLNYAKCYGTTKHHLVRDYARERERTRARVRTKLEFRRACNLIVKLKNIT